jgi:thioredoxin reductase (NADPH)
VQEAEAAGRLRVLLQSEVKAITPDGVYLEHKGQRVDLPNDAIIVCAGGVLPTGFLKTIGLEVETKFGTV